MEAKKQVYREFSILIAKAGFRQRRTRVLWERNAGEVWERVHLHKFSFMNSFRVHGAIHVMGSEDEAPWLNGPYSNDGYFIPQSCSYLNQRSSFSFSSDPARISQSAKAMNDYVESVLLPWFLKWSNPTDLLAMPDSPLRKESKILLSKRLRMKA